jgi:hypothetical protein
MLQLQHRGFIVLRYMLNISICQVLYKSLFAKIRCYNRLHVRRHTVCYNIHKYDAINRLQYERRLCVTNAWLTPVFLTVQLLLSLKTITIIKDLCSIIILNTQYWNKLGHLSQIIATDWNEHSLIPRSGTRSFPLPWFVSQIFFGKISNKRYATATVVIHICKTTHLLL